MVVPRFLEPELAATFDESPAVLVCGPRQVGKSHLVEQFCATRHIPLITFDDWEVRDFAERNPAEFLQRYGHPLAIDEVQRVPKLLLALKARIDRNRQPGMFLLTGSADIRTLPKVADSLAGRMAVLALHPLLQTELDTAPATWIDTIFQSNKLGPAQSETIAELLQRMILGGYPEPRLQRTERTRDRWFRDYTSALIERDIRDLANLEGLSHMPRLFALVAARSGTVLNVSSLARETGIPATTLTRYLDLLNRIFLIQDVPAWRTERGQRVLKTSKTFLNDSGLLCSLQNWSATYLLQHEAARTTLMRQFVANQLAGLIPCSNTQPQLFHLRTVKNFEVDFVLESPSGELVGLTIEATERTSPSSLKGLRYLQEIAGQRFIRGFVLNLGSQIIPLDERIDAIPVTTLWSKPA